MALAKPGNPAFYSRGQSRLWAMSASNMSSNRPAAGAGELIYVVDDEPMLLELALVILEPAGFKVRTFRDPEQAIAEFSRSQPRPDVIVTDYAMHSMDGMQLVERFRRVDPELKILLVSGTVGEEIYRSTLTKPDKFLPKPYQAHELIAAVRSLLDRR
jgi:DNA-binding response OmpR family regulator